MKLPISDGPTIIPPGFGLRQSSGALASQDLRLKCGSGLPQSKTLSRPTSATSFSRQF